MKHTIKHIHFVGIGGAGMSAIAEIMHNLGYRVSGSDQADSAVTQRLAALGITVFIGHAAANIEGAQAVVTSTAVKGDNPEVVAARAQRVPVVARAVLLAELMRNKTGIAIAGTHGKTTTTSLVASVLAEAGEDPTFVIGGLLMSVGANARLGAGEHIVVEADESDASFLHLSPIVSVVTNIDADHMATYGHKIERLHAAFVAFLERLPFYGRAVLCIDDFGVRAILPQVQRPIVTYGLDEAADLRAVDVRAFDGAHMQFVARQAGRADLPVTLNLAGVHNVRNALAAIAVARELRLPDEPIARALAAFAGVGRRFERYGDLPVPASTEPRHVPGTFTLIDDYGHHPVEIAAVIAATRQAFPGRRLVLAFQPHRFSRTQDHFDDFAVVLSRADLLFVTDVYAAGEQPIWGYTAYRLVQAVQESTVHDVTRREARYVPSVDALPQAITEAVRAGDVVITMGAGSIAGVAPQLKLALEAQA
jgi:UDP-N-acetylmuramate--alanine ligase